MCPSSHTYVLLNRYYQQVHLLTVYLIANKYHLLFCNRSKVLQTHHTRCLEEAGQEQFARLILILILRYWYWYLSLESLFPFHNSFFSTPPLPQCGLYEAGTILLDDIIHGYLHNTGISSRFAETYCRDCIFDCQCCQELLWGSSWINSVPSNTVSSFWAWFYFFCKTPDK